MLTVPTFEEQWPLYEDNLKAENGKGVLLK